MSAVPGEGRTKRISAPDILGRKARDKIVVLTAYRGARWSVAAEMRRPAFEEGVDSLADV